MLLNVGKVWSSLKNKYKGIIYLLKCKEALTALSQPRHTTGLVTRNCKHKLKNNIFIKSVFDLFVNTVLSGELCYWHHVCLSIEQEYYQVYIVQGDTFFKDLLRYPHGQEGVYALGGPAFLAHAMQRVNYIVGLKALQLAFFK